MKLFRMFSIGSDRILAKNCCVPGKVIHVEKSCLYVIKKPVRLYAHEGNTRFSHWITFTYKVNGIPYTGKLFVLPHYRCPQKEETLEVYYDPDKPENYALYSFGPAVNPIGW